MILLGSTLSIPHDDIFVNYTRAHVLRGPDSEDIVTIGIDRSLTDMTFLALATTFFGAKHREAAIIQKGLGRYSGAIKVVNSAIGNPDRRQSFDLLEAIVVLSIFEVSHSFSRTFLGIGLPVFAVSFWWPSGIKVGPVMLVGWRG